MLLNEVVREIKNKQFAPLYVLFGTETFLMEEFTTFARNEIIDPAYADLNIGLYDCTQTPLDMILQDADTLPFLADHRLIIADQAYFLTGAKPPVKMENDPDLLTKYIENPSPYTSVILKVETEKLDERKKVVKALQKKAVVLAFQSLRDQELFAWIKRRAKKWGATIEHEEAALLIERVGNELRLLNKEIEKLALYVGAGGAKITREVIELLSSRTLEQDVFSLIEDVVSGRLTKAFRTLYDCFKTGEEPIKLMALMARQFRLLLHVKLWAPKGYTQQQLAGMLKVHPYAVKKAMEQARTLEEDSLRRLLAILAEEDFRMKSGQVDKRLALEVFITKVAGELNKEKSRLK